MNSKNSPSPRGPLTLAAAGTVAVASLLSMFSTAGLFSRWLAVFGLLLTLPYLAPILRRWTAERLPERAKPLLGRWPTWLPYGLVTIGTLAALGPVALGQMPISQDHVNHYFATHVLVDELIPSFRFFGWTDSIGTGYPFGDLYHTAGYLVTGALHLLTFGLVDLDVSYAFGICFSWLLPALALTAWARRFAGPWGATLAGLVFALDPGGDREGGWGYAMFHGVWAQHLALGTWLLSLLALWRLAEKPSTRRLGAAALLSGLTLWLHPINAIVLPLAGLMLLAVRLFAQRDDSPRGALRVTAALGIGGLIGLAWIIRMLLGGDQVYAFSSSWKPIETLMERMLAGDLFDNQIVLVTPLALIGAVATLRLRNAFALLTLLLAGAIVLVGSMDLLIGSDLGLAGGKLGLLQYRRFAIPAKPLWYALAGAGLSALGPLLGRARAANEPPGSTTWSRRALVALVLSPFAWGLLCALPGLIEGPAARPLTLARTGEPTELSEIHATLSKERSRCAHRPCRAVYWEEPGHGGLYPVISLADLDYAWLPMLQLPANNYKHQGTARSPKEMAHLGAIVAVSKWPQKHALLEPLGQYGKHHLYRISPATDGRYEIRGPGKVSVDRWDPEHRILRVSGASDESVLTLLHPPYRKWRAHQRGKRLDTKMSRRGSLSVFEVHGIQDGPLELIYEDDLSETAFGLLGLLLILGCLVGVIAPARPLPTLLAREPEVIAKIARVALVVIPVAGAVTVGVLGDRAAKREWIGAGSAETDLTGVLHRDGLADFELSPENACVRPYTRNPRFGCTESSFAPRLRPARRRGDKVPSCLAIGVPAGGRSTVRFDVPRGTTVVKGRLQLIEGPSPRARLSAAGESIDLPPATKNGAPFAAPVAAKSIALFFESNKKARVCLELVGVSD